MNLDANNIIDHYRKLYSEVVHENVVLKAIIEAKEQEEDNHGSNVPATE